KVGGAVREVGVEGIVVDMPGGTMHLMGMLRIPDRDLAIAWPGRLAVTAVEALRARGYRVLFLPEGATAERNTALNFVTLGPGRIMMAEGYPIFERFFEKAGIACRTTPVGELRKAAGGLGCLTGILERAPGA